MFKQLHAEQAPLLLCNVWDVASAKIAETMGYQAIGTSSAAIASVLGYADGEEMSFGELCYMVKRICANTSLPVTVDLEAGFGNSVEAIVANIRALAEYGVVGINIEDSTVVIDSNSQTVKRTLVDALEFAKTLSQINLCLKEEGLDMFINVRTDAFLIGEAKALEETRYRASLYQQAKADGIFVPCVEQEEDIQMLVNSINIPLNVMYMPNLPAFDRLQNLGVKRISMGNFLHDHMMGSFQKTLEQLSQQQTCAPVFPAC